MPRQRHPEILACTPRPQMQSPYKVSHTSVSTKDAQRGAAIAGLYKPGSDMKYCQYWKLATGLCYKSEHTEGMPDSKPRLLKLWKYLKQTSTLTSHFAETRVLTIVDSLWKHKHIRRFTGLSDGPMENVDSGWTKHWDSWIRVGKPAARKCPKDVLQKKEEMDEDYQENWKASSANPHPSSPETENKQTNKNPHRKSLELERTHIVSHSCERRNDKKDSTEPYQLILQDQESSDYSHALH